MPLLIAAYCFIAPPPAQDAKVTVKQTARVESVLQAISKQTGVPLSARKEEADDVLIVALSNVPLKEAMDRIAWATYGRWEKEGSGFRLARDIAAERRTERAHIERVTAMIDDSIKLYRQAVLQPETLAPEKRPVLPGPPGRQAPVVPTPETRLMANLVTGISTKELVRFGITSDSHILTVYSSQPTPVELPFGPNADRFLNQYIAEKRATGFDWGTRLPLRAMLKGSCGPMGGGAELTLFNAKGESMLGTLPRIVITFRPTASAPYEIVPKAIVDAIPPDMKVPLSEISRPFSRPKEYDPEQVFSPSKAEYGNREFFRRLGNPEQYEPLGAFATDLWTAVAAKAGRNLVANVPDMFLVPTWSSEPPRIRELFDYQLDTAFDLQPGWMTLRPAGVRPGERHQVNRAALGRYVRSRAAYRTPERLYASADFVANSGVKELSRAIGFYVYWASEGNLTSDGSGAWALERFFATLPNATRQAWLSGTPVDVSTLSLDARKALVGWMTQVRSHRPEVASIPELFLEPTVRFPQGYVTQGWLRATGQDLAGFATRIPAEEEGKFGEQWNSLESLAWLLGAMTKNSERVQIHPATLRSVRIAAEAEGDPVVAARMLEKFTSEPTRYVPWEQAAPTLVESIRVARTKSPRPRNPAYGE